MNSELIGQQIENYRIVEAIGGGGMGTVYRARDVNLARPVAMKVMHPQFANRPRFQQRFQQEAQAAARLNHPSIAAVYHFGRQPGLLYIVMAYVPGLSLGAYLKRLSQQNQVVKLDETLALITQVADALGYAHRQGVVHRDVKPDNIIVTRADPPEHTGAPPLRAVVTDFGLAKLLEGGIETQSGTFMGTLPYMSPEQVMAKPLDGRSDIYSLGVILYQLATGQLPFDIKTPTDAVVKHLNEAPPFPHDLQPGLPTAVETVILKAMAKKPEDRYQTGEELAQELRSATADLSQDDVTHFATDSEIITLVTRIEEPAPVDLDEIEFTRDDADRLIIAKEGDTSYSRRLRKSTLTIGRSQENDIPLPEGNVSRVHVRLERRDESWYVVDLGSTNGSLLDDDRLPANVAVKWKRGQVLQIGPYALRWRSASSPTAPTPPTPVISSADMPESPAKAGPRPGNGWEGTAVLPKARPSAPAFWSDMRPRTLTNQGLCRVLIRNTGSTKTTYTLTTHSTTGGLTFDQPQKQITIGSGEKGMVDFLVEGKRPFVGGATSYPFRIQITTPAADPQQHEADLHTKPWLPAWFVGVLMALALLICTGGALLLGIF